MQAVEGAYFHLLINSFATSHIFYFMHDSSTVLQCTMLDVHDSMLSCHICAMYFYTAVTKNVFFIEPKVGLLFPVAPGPKVT